MFVKCFVSFAVPTYQFLLLVGPSMRPRTKNFFPINRRVLPRTFCTQASNQVSFKVSGGGLRLLNASTIPTKEQYDYIIDVRSPSEYELDHVPDAINLPVLNDTERCIVGTLYKRDMYAARLLGAGMVGSNIGKILTRSPLCNMDGNKIRSTRLLVYCWRGGERSNSLAAVLSRIGFQTTVLVGGYKSYRKLVTDVLKNHVSKLVFFLIDGPSGSGKGELLCALRAGGAQTLDLEAAAGHAGSVFGAPPGGATQPSQRTFETRLAAQLAGFCAPGAAAGGPVFVEAESAMLGRRALPREVLAAMRAAGAAGRRAQLELALSERVRRIRGAYAHLELPEAAPLVAACLQALRPRAGGAAVERWAACAAAGDLDGAVEGMLRDYYDPAYRRSSRRLFSRAAAAPAAPDAAPATAAAAAADASAPGPAERPGGEGGKEVEKGVAEAPGAGGGELVLRLADGGAGAYRAAAAELVRLARALLKFTAAEACPEL